MPIFCLKRGRIIVIKHISITGYRMRPVHDILSRSFVSAVDRTASFLDMDLTDFINGLDGFEWKPKGRHMKFSQELYSSILAANGMKAISRPALISLMNSAGLLGMTAEELIRGCSLPDDGIRKTRVSFGPLPMRTVAMT